MLEGKTGDGESGKISKEVFESGKNGGKEYFMIKGDERKGKMRKNE